MRPRAGFSRHRRAIAVGATPCRIPFPDAGRQSPRALTPSRALLPLLLLSISGCVAVAPFERGRLASPAMEQGADLTGVAGAYRAKVLESKVGGGLPGTAPGGGCGCTQ
jgi:hypothetical protein